MTEPTIELIAVKDLKPHPQNWRLHPEPQMAALAESVDRHGVLQFPVWNRRTGHTLDGHARVKLAGERKLKDLKVVVVDVPETKELQILVTLDRVGEMRTRDEGALVDLLRALEAEQAVPLAWDDEFDKLIGAAVLAENRALGNGAGGLADEGADIPVEVEKGDTWVLGEHRLLCGDSGGDGVDPLLAEMKPTLMVTDPPYGVNYDPAWRLMIQGSVADVKRFGVFKGDDSFNWFTSLSRFTGDVLYIWLSSSGMTDALAMIEALGFDVRSHIIWVKQTFVLSRGDYHWQHEPCLYCVRKKKKSNWAGSRAESTTWMISNDNAFGRAARESEEEEVEKAIHATRKPIECMLRAIKNHHAECVYDPFVGSGTTLIAAEKLGRRCLAVELEPLYCQIAINRWQRLTGEKAIKV